MEIVAWVIFGIIMLLFFHDLIFGLIAHTYISFMNMLYEMKHWKDIDG